MLKIVRWSAKNGGDMLIKEWLVLQDITGKDFATALEIHPTHFYNIVELKQRTSKKLANRIEMMTEGKVTAQEILTVPLRPKPDKKPEKPKEVEAYVRIPLKEYLFLKSKVA